MSKDFKTRESWLEYRARKPKLFKWAFVSLKPNPKTGKLEGLSYENNRRKNKNIKLAIKNADRTRKRAARLADRKGPVEAVSIE